MARGKAGYKGRIQFGDTVINGMMTWNYSGSVRDLADDSALRQEIKTYVALQIEGGTVTMNGNFLLDGDAGQQALKDAFDNATELDNIRLYIDDSNYYELDSSTDPASYAIVSKYDDIGVDKAGIISIASELKISGVMKLHSTTTSVAAETIGAIDEAADAVTLIGKLVCIGEEDSVSAYFEYGETSSYGSDTSVDATTMTAIDIFDNDLTGLDALTTYHYRAVIELSDTSKVYGADQTFTTSS